jgi:hypothetical protein
LQVGAEPICWPTAIGCERLRVFSHGAIRGLMFLELAGALAVGALFRQESKTRFAWSGLLLLEALKIGILLLDFRLRMNQHYMASFAAFAFLFVPQKRAALQVLIRLFYFWAGTLKLNRDWLSGGDLYAPLWFIHGPALVGAACAYVVLLELVIGWGVFAKKRWIFWSTLAQLALFHVMSWPIVGFFYPMLMFALLAIYPLARCIPATESKMEWPVYALAGFFSLLQLVPYAFPGNTAMTGEGRLFALHMFDANVSCEAYAELKGRNGTVVRRGLKLPLDRRMACDPLVFYNRARNLCQHRAFDDLDLIVNASPSDDREMSPLAEIHDFCTHDPGYRVLSHNAWIKTD